MLRDPSASHLALLLSVLPSPGLCRELNIVCSPSAIHMLKFWSPWYGIWKQGLRKVCCCRSVTKLCLILQPQGQQHARLLCPSLSPAACSNSFESMMSSNHLILCCPLLLLPSIFPSFRVFSNESVLCIKVLEFQLQHQSFHWIFRIDFL